MLKTVTFFVAKTTLKWEVSAGDYILWLRWRDIFSSKSDIAILDFWEMRDGDSVSITSRIEDLPTWFELHPTEVSGLAACSMMQKKLASGYKPGEPFDGPNLWRVLTGDRIVRIRAENGSRTQTLVAFKSNALVFGERHIHSNDLGWFLSFGAPLESRMTDEMASHLRTGLEVVRELGLPREVGSTWTLG